MDLRQGDCLTVLPALADASIDAVITDLPYGVSRAKWDIPIDLEKLWPELRRVLKPDGLCAMFGTQPFTSKLILSNLKEYRYCWYWQKTFVTGFLDAKKRPLRCIEEVVIFSRQQPRYFPQMKKLDKPRLVNKQGAVSTVLYNTFKRGPAHLTDVEYPRNLIPFASERSGHPTAKPVALLEYLIKTYTKPGDTVLDVAMGGGSTGVAARNTGREFVGIEIDGTYYEMAKARINADSVGDRG